jgi:hypothetical protein
VSAVAAAGSPLPAGAAAALVASAAESTGRGLVAEAAGGLPGKLRLSGIQSFMAVADATAKYPLPVISTAATDWFLKLKEWTLPLGVTLG